MLRVVLDTNVIISDTITDHGVPFQILKKWEQGHFVLIVSEPILQEVDRVFHYPHIKEKRHLTKRDISSVLQTLRRYGINTPAEIIIEAVSQDPADNKFIVAAVEGEADYIVSGDRHLRSLESYRGIKIVSPSEFVEVLR
jgi:hypothetical protein